MELRPAVVIPAVRIGAALEQQANEREVAGHSEQVVAVRAPLFDELRIPAEQRSASTRLTRPRQLAKPCLCARSRRASATVTPAVVAMPSARPS
ncbi:MAG TPA: hypothetical protein VJ375_04025 [Gaiellaceae bacterium]|nr:hypothetical protein [Gaiellaceae bacterium]